MSTLKACPVGSEAIVHVATSLAACRTPREYRLSLEAFAVHYGVHESDLATDVLAVLCNLS
jgi:hypothetical protein